MKESVESNNNILHFRYKTESGEWLFCLLDPMLFQSILVFNHSGNNAFNMNFGAVKNLNINKVGLI